MEIKIINIRHHVQKRLAKLLMKAFFFLLCTTVLGFTPKTSFSQVKITINADKNVTIHEVFRIIKNQTEYRFIYPEDLFENIPNIKLKKGTISLDKLLNQSLSKDLFIFQLEDKNIIISKRDKQFQNIIEDQQISVTGQVLDQGQVPLIGVNIIVQGTSRGTQTDFDGNYTIAAAQGEVLIFSYVGFETETRTVGSDSNIDVILQEGGSVLDEIMIIAYGTAKKSTFTGSAATIMQETFDNRAITEVSQALTATTPGLQIGTSNGQPGSAPTIRIRGIGSFNASNSPLIILDGMPYDNSITSINPNDIESVTVLKDASSAALYGARGANGVLLINTKKGKSGKPSVNVKYSFGLTSRQSADYKRLNDTDYMELFWESHRNSFMLNDGKTEAEANALAGSALLAGLSYNPYLMDASELFDNNGKLNPNAKNHWAEDTDWYGGIVQLGKRHDTNLSISGGNDKTDYYTSLGYVNEEGFIIGSEFSRLTAKANANSQITNWLKLGTNLNTSYSTTEGQQNETSGSLSNPFRATRNIGNIFPIHLHNPITGEYILDEDGNKIPDFGSGWTSPDGSIVIPGRDGFAGTNHPYEVRNIYNGYLRQTINLKGYADISLMEGLKLTLNGGLGNNMYRSWAGGFIYEQKGNAGSSSQNTSTTTTMTFQQLLNYSKDIGNHHIDVLLGHESYQYKYHYLSTSMNTQTIPGDNFEYANFTEINAFPNSYTHNYRVEGYLSRINYDYDGKYMASASFRRDGSSRFYKDARWGNFWSVGAGWSLDRENFMDDVNFINRLKLRGSYGVVGNDDLSSYYPWRATYEPNDNGEPGFVQSSLGNDELTWETSKSFDIATEFSLLNNRLEGSIEYFHRVSSNLLFSVPKPISSGLGSVDLNAGSMYNKGVEIALDGELIRNENFSFRLNANATILKNKITELPLAPYNSSIYRIEEGHSRYDFYLRNWYGVNPDNGFNLFKADENQFEFEPGELKEIDGVMYTENIEKSLYEYSGSSLPKVNGGFGANIGWGNFNLKFNFYYQLGGKFYDSQYKSFMTGSLAYGKQHKDLLKRWRKPGDITDVTIVTSGTNVTNINADNSTKWLVASDMLELTNVNLSYNVPKSFFQNKNISNVIIYASADNALLFAKRQGLYPRRSFTSGYLANSDVYPPSAVVSFGLSLNF